MKELVEYIAKAIVHRPEEVKVSQVEENGMIVLTLEVAAEDKGRIIGKEGRVARAMRTLLRVTAVKEGARVMLKIL